jgi:hypothetical protein
LIAAGVEHYHVDYAGLRKTFYSARGDAAVTTINYEGLPPVTTGLDATALRTNFRDSQMSNQHYRDCTWRAMAAGVQCYFAFLLPDAILLLSSESIARGRCQLIYPSGFDPATM